MIGMQNISVASRWGCCALLGIVVLMAGCASQTFSPASAPAYLVLRDGTEFYRFGPLQATPPDAILPKDTPLKVLRREIGYSLVQDANAQTGYVANENIIVDPTPPIESTPINADFYEPVSDHSNVDRPSPSLMVDDAPLPLPDLETELPDHPDL